MSSYFQKTADAIITNTCRHLYPDQSLHHRSIRSDLVFHKLSPTLMIPLRVFTVLFGVSSIFWNGKPYWHLTESKQRSWDHFWKKSFGNTGASVFRFYENIAILMIEQ